MDTEQRKGAPKMINDSVSQSDGRGGHLDLAPR